MISNASTHHPNFMKSLRPSRDGRVDSTRGNLLTQGHQRDKDRGRGKPRARLPCKVGPRSPLTKRRRGAAPDGATGGRTPSDTGTGSFDGDERTPRSERRDDDGHAAPPLDHLRSQRRPGLPVGGVRPSRVTLEASQATPNQLPHPGRPPTRVFVCPLSGRHPRPPNAGWGTGQAATDRPEGAEPTTDQGQR